MHAIESFTGLQFFELCLVSHKAIPSLHLLHRGECNCSTTTFQGLCNTIQKFQSSF
jgi:hypothetical protein